MVDNKKLKDAITHTKLLKVSHNRDDYDDDLSNFKQKKVVEIQFRGPNLNEQLWSLESIIQSEIAILHKRIGSGEQLDKTDHKRLVDLVDMMTKLERLKLENKKQNILEGRSNREMKEMVEAAMEVLDGEIDE